jgi:hypothetical protein
MILGTFVTTTRAGNQVVALLIGTVKVEWFSATRENYKS